ncbi:MAG: CmcJ/NvfI family oxidoreductase [Rhodospirillales bacterium]
MSSPDTPQHESATVKARLNYIVDNGVAPIHDITETEEIRTRPGTYEERTVIVRDGRPVKSSFDLETHGFAFVEGGSAVRNFYDPDEVSSIYFPEIENLIEAYTGAAKVVIFDHTIRCADEPTRKEKVLREPVKRVHNDYTEDSAPQRVRDLLPPAEAEARLKKRFMIIQVWRPTRGPVLSEPLAVSDARTIGAANCITVQRRYPNRIAYTYHIAYDPGHVWYYFPKMTPAEALIFKVYDSDKSAPARFTAHTAFDDPASPSDAPFRESIEVRALAFFD